METINSLRINGVETNNMKDIVNHFNSYFANVGKMLSTKIPQASGSYLDTIAHNYNIYDSIFITPTDKAEIIAIVRDLKLKNQLDMTVFQQKS